MFAPCVPLKTFLLHPANPCMGTQVSQSRVRSVHDMRHIEITSLKICPFFCPTNNLMPGHLKK